MQRAMWSRSSSVWVSGPTGVSTAIEAHFLQEREDVAVAVELTTNLIL